MGIVVAGQARGLAFSPDGKHHAFIEPINLSSGYSSGRLVVDGKATDKGQAVSNPQYMADGRLTYLARAQRGRGHTLFIEGKPVGPNAKSFDVIFSPDRKRYAYVSDQLKGRFWVVDGKLLPHPGGVQGVFSPDSRHFAYTGPAKDGNGQQVYLDGQPVGPTFQALLVTARGSSPSAETRFQFNPDGNFVVLTQDNDNTIHRITITP
jgi:WD40 repeat protein